MNGRKRDKKTKPAAIRRAPAQRKELAARKYDRFLGSVAEILEAARHTSARAVNAIMTATYWEIGRRIVEFEQGGRPRAEYGQALLERLSADLTGRYGRGFGVVNLSQMKRFYLLWPAGRIFQTASEELSLGEDTRHRTLILQTVSERSDLSSPNLQAIAQRFPLPWSAYVRLLAVKDELARDFYETEALRGGWSVRMSNCRVLSCRRNERNLQDGEAHDSVILAKEA